MKPAEEWLEAAVAESIHPLVLPFAILIGLVLAGMVVSFFALARVRAVAQDAADRAENDKERSEGALESLRKELSALTAQVEEIRTEVAAVPAAPKPGFNLSKRSQALRMHRRGQPPGQIASALGVPVQEVELLVKIHRIVIANL